MKNISTTLFKTAPHVVLVFLLGCTSSPQATDPSAKAAQNVLDAGLGPGEQVKDNPDLALIFESIQGPIPKEKWLASYKRQFSRAYAVVVAKVNSHNRVACLEIWKDRGGRLRVGQELGVLTPGGQDGFFHPSDPATGLLIFFFSPPEQDGEKSQDTIQDGKVAGATITVTELRDALVGPSK